MSGLQGGAPSHPRVQTCTAMRLSCDPLTGFWGGQGRVCFALLGKRVSGPPRPHLRLLRLLLSACAVCCCSADEDDMVNDPDLRHHLAHWGINMLQVGVKGCVCGVLTMGLHVQGENVWCGGQGCLHELWSEIPHALRLLQQGLACNALPLAAAASCVPGPSCLPLVAAAGAAPAAAAAAVNTTQHNTTHITHKTDGEDREDNGRAGDRHECCV